MAYRLLPIVLFLLSASSQSLQAQISQGGQPLAFQAQHRERLARQALQPIQLPAPDVEKLRAEDALAEYFGRFAAPILTDISPANAGVWTDLPGSGDRLWRCAVKAPGALALTLLFDDFHLPPGSRLFAYTPDGRRLRGAYTDASCTASGKFTIGVLPGETAILEYYEPADMRSQARLHLNRVDYAYQRALLAEADPAALLDFGESLPCNVNVNCPAGANWQTEKKGVARILMVFSNGEGWCTGTLIANTSGTGDPHFLTAHHCEIIGTSPDFEQWVFDFDYESADCNNPATQPTPKSVLGCERKAFRAETDFLLLKLNTLPSQYGLYFNGWTRSATPPANTTFIHHPTGDIKKISVDNQAPVIHPGTINWGGQFGTSPVNTHWKALPDVGIFQPGSSGCPLFDPNKRIIGQLHGGLFNQMDPCIITATYFGRFDISWNQGATPDTRLKEWLDPNGTDAQTQNGYAQPIPTTFSISGTVQTHWGVAMPGVKIILSGGATDTIPTSPTGYFQFNALPAGLTYNLRAVYDTTVLNGVTTFDMVLMSKQVLGLDTLDTPYQIVAADVNGSNSLTTYDIVETRKVVLNINPTFPNGMPSWRFIPAGFAFTDPLQPFLNTIPNTIQYTNLSQNVTGANFKGLKVGDTNNSASPGQ